VVFFILWLVFAIAVGIAAGRRCHRSGIGWGLLAILISPLLAGLLLLLLGPLPVQQLQPQPVVNWNAIDWTAGEIAKPQPIVPQPGAEPISTTALVLWLSVLPAILVAVTLVVWMAQ
jgi:hypothetical protein